MTTDRQHTFYQNSYSSDQSVSSLADRRHNLSKPSHVDRRGSTIFYQPSAQPFTLEQGEAFHHFLAETSKTIASEDIPDWFWNIEVPRLALQNDYLFNAILALSALHRSHLRHSNHQVPLTVNQSISWHRKSILSFAHVVTNITPRNCTAAIAMAALSAVYSCGLAQLLSSLQEREHIDQFISIILATYKGLQLFRSFFPWLEAQGLRMMSPKKDEDAYNSTAILGDKASRLSVLNSMSQDNSTEKQTYEATILAFRNNNEQDWIMTVPSHFMSLLQQKKPMAVLILAVFSMKDGVETEKPPWFATLWHSKLREYFIEYLGPMWTQYTDLSEDSSIKEYHQPSAASNVDSCPEYGKDFGT